MVRKFKLKDTDKDGVIDFMDCEPNNPKEHGLFTSLAIGTAGSYIGSQASRAIAKRQRIQRLKKINEEKLLKRKTFFK